MSIKIRWIINDRRHKCRELDLLIMRKKKLNGLGFLRMLTIRGSLTQTDPHLSLCASNWTLTLRFFSNHFPNPDTTPDTTYRHSNSIRLKTHSYLLCRPKTNVSDAISHTELKFHFRDGIWVVIENRIEKNRTKQNAKETCSKAIGKRLGECENQQKDECTISTQQAANTNDVS